MNFDSAEMLMPFDSSDRRDSLQILSPSEFFSSEPIKPGTMMIALLLTRSVADSFCPVYLCRAVIVAVPFSFTVMIPSPETAMTPGSSTENAKSAGRENGPQENPNRSQNDVADDLVTAFSTVFSSTCSSLTCAFSSVP